MKRKVSVLLILALILTPLTSFASTYDFIKKKSGEIYTFSQVRGDPFLAIELRTNISDYKREGLEGKLYEASQIQILTNQGLTFNESVAKLENGYYYFHELWDRFEETINLQAQKTTPKDKITVKFDASNNKVNIKVLESYQKEGVLAIVFETGLKTAIINMLKSEKVIKISSEGLVIETLNIDGLKKDDEELQDEAMQVAISWLGKNKLSTPIQDYLIGSTFEFIIYGELEDGSESSEIYSLYFY